MSVSYTHLDVYKRQAVELPGGDFGAGYVIPGSNPAFQANSLTAPTDESAASAAPFATLNPQPASAYTIGNLGGVFGSCLLYTSRCV